MKTPFAWLASRYQVSPRLLRLAAGTALVLSVVIIVTGATVRVTGSGLGCETWPYCTAETLAPTSEMGIHGVIEFGNRLLTLVLCVVVGLLIIAARLQPVVEWQVVRAAWAQFWVIVLNAVIGGITVWTELNPYVVAGHFIAAILLLTATTITWQRVSQDSRIGNPAGTTPLRAMRMALFLTAIAVVVFGTMVTGSGPHAGDSADIPRMPFNWLIVSRLHSIAAVAMVCVAIALWIVSRRYSTEFRRTITGFIIVVALQGCVGILQVAMGLPELIVVLHLLGAALVWIGATRILVQNPARGFASASTLHEHR